MPFNLINPLFNNPLLGDEGAKMVDKALTEAGLKASPKELLLEAELREAALANGTTPWVEAINRRRELGKAQKKRFGGPATLRDLEHKFYAEETASLGPMEAAQMFIGGFAHPALKKAGLRGADNRETSAREVVSNIEGAGLGAARWLRDAWGLD